MEQSSVLFSPISPQLREAAESPDLQRDKRWRLCEISDCSILWRVTGLEERGALGSTPRGRTAGPREEGWPGLGLMELCHDPGGSQHPWPWVMGRLSPSGQWESADPPQHFLGLLLVLEHLPTRLCRGVPGCPCQDMPAGRWGVPRPSSGCAPSLRPHHSLPYWVPRAAQREPASSSSLGRAGRCWKVALPAPLSPTARGSQPRGCACMWV